MRDPESPRAPRMHGAPQAYAAAHRHRGWKSATTLLLVVVVTSLWPGVALAQSSTPPVWPPGPTRPPAPLSLLEVAERYAHCLTWVSQESSPGAARVSFRLDRPSWVEGGGDGYRAVLLVRPSSGGDAVFAWVDLGRGDTDVGGGPSTPDAPDAYSFVLANQKYTARHGGHRDGEILRAGRYCLGAVFGVV